MAKRIISFIIVFILMLTQIASAEQIKINAINRTVSDSILYRKRVYANTELNKHIFKTDYSEKESYFEVTVNGNDELNYTFCYKNQFYDGILKGSIEQFNSGFVGVFDGALNASIKDHGQFDDDSIVVDIYFNDNDLFATITICDLSFENGRCVLFYGDPVSTKQIAYEKNLSIEPYSYIDEKELPCDTIVLDKTKGASGLTYKGGDACYIDNYIAGDFSAYHSNYITSGGPMTVMVKLNSNSSGVSEYFDDTLSSGTFVTSIKINRFNLTMRSNIVPLHVLTNSFTPQNSITTLTIPVPYYMPSPVGIGTFNVTIVTSSTTATEFAYPNNNAYNNQGINWVLKKTSGWNCSSFDGDYSTQSGVACSATYIFEDIINSASYETMYFSGKIYYYYKLFIYESYYWLTMPTDTADCTTSVIIYP